MHIALGLNIGGLEKVIIDLLKGTDRSRFRPIVCCISSENALADEAEHLGVPVILLNHIQQGRFLRKTVIVFRLAQLMEKEKIRIVHTHNPLPHLYGSLAARLVGIPVVVHTKHGRNYPANKKRVFLNRLLSYLTDEIVTVSKDAYDVSVNIENVKKRKVSTIINGIDVEKYAQSNNGMVIKKKTRKRGTHPRPLPGGEEKTRPGNEKAKESPFPSAFRKVEVIGHVARLSPEKDQCTLLKAFAIVAKRRENVTLVIAGDGQMRQELQQEAIQLGVADKVSFLGFRGDIPELLQTFDLFVLTSIKEGTSLTILEAMAAGLPVVATDVGGNPEIVEHGHTGYIVPPKHPERLADAIIEVLSDRERATTMGANGRIIAQQKYSLENMCRAYEDIYWKLLAK